MLTGSHINLENDSFCPKALECYNLEIFPSQNKQKYQKNTVLEQETMAHHFFETQILICVTV